ncbi:hypothetical protein SLEP1_g17633 [Rubroshorea leprosula]|uniref:Uncharacterized protein n=1 Tax=Rubroshorea leprosula TaxID=152421 RepID=A0AAV5IUX5_9ROSI|nr:hypothetical protein SLEP1_g17633 [Rubroshorea leprosula]
MLPQLFKTCYVLVVLLLLANSGMSARPTSELPSAPITSAVSESMFLPDTQITESEPGALSPTYSSLPPAADVLETKYNETLSQDNPSPPLASPPYASDVSQSVDASVLDTRNDENLSQVIISVPPPSSPSTVQDSPAVEPKNIEDLFQENTSLPPSPSYTDVPALDTTDGGSFSQENSSVSSPSLYADGSALSDDVKSPAISPSYPDTPASEATNGESFSDQGNQYGTSIVYSSAPETKTEADISPEYSSSVAAAPPSNAETTQNPENVPEMNDYISTPKSAAPAQVVQLPFPESDAEPTTQMAPSTVNGDGVDLAPISHHTILPFNYRAEDEPVEPYEDEESSWDRMNGALAGVLVGVCVVGVGGFVYKKRKNNLRAQYESLAKKGEL